MKIVRESKFRHTYGELFKKELFFQQVCPSILVLLPWFLLLLQCQLRPVFEGTRHHIAANDKYFLFSGQGGGGPVIKSSMYICMLSCLLNARLFPGLLCELERTWPSRCKSPKNHGKKVLILSFVALKLAFYIHFSFN